MHVSNLDMDVTEDLVYELFLQATPLVDVLLPDDPQAPGRHRGWALVDCISPESAAYAARLLDRVSF